MTRPVTHRLNTMVVFGAIALVVAITLGYPLLFEGKTLFSFPGSPWLDPEAAFAIDAPTARIIHNIVLDGDIPLWNAFSGIGSSLIADPHVSFFSPFRLILYWFPTTAGWDVFTILRLVALIYFTFRLLTRLRICPFVSLSTAILYGYSGHIFHFLNLTHISSIAFIPLFLEGVVCTFQRDYRAALPRATIGLALIVFGGGLLDLVLTGVLTALLGLAFLVTSLPRGERANSMTSVGLLGVYLLLGIALSAVFLVPYLELRQYSVPPFQGRSTVTFNDPGYSLAMFVSGLYEPRADISNYYMKFRQYTHLIILPGLLLSPIGLLNRATRVFCIAALAFVFLYWSKLYGLGYLEFVNATPLLQDVRFEKYQAVLHLCLYCLSAIGLHAVIRGRSGGLMIAFCVAGAGVALLPLALVLFPALRPELATRALAYTAVAIALIGIVVLVYRTRGAGSPGINALLICSATLLIFVQIRIDMPSQLADRNIVFPDKQKYHFPMLERLTRDARMMSFTGYNPKVWSGYRIRDVRDFSIVHIQRYRKLFKKHLERRQCWHFMALCSDNPQSFNIPLAKYLGVRYLSLDRSQLPLLEQNPYGSYEIIEDTGDVLIVDLGNTDPLIKAYDEVRTMRADAILKRVTSVRTEQRHTALVEEPVDWRSENQDPLQARIEQLQWGNNEIEVTLNLDRKGFVVLRAQHYPGWRAYIDGIRTEIFRAEYLFQGVIIPEGKHTLTLRYVPTSFLLGLLISAAGLLATIYGHNRIDPTRRS